MPKTPYLRPVLKPGYKIAILRPHAIEHCVARNETMVDQEEVILLSGAKPPVKARPGKPVSYRPSWDKAEGVWFLASDRW